MINTDLQVPESLRVGEKHKYELEGFYLTLHGNPSGFIEIFATINNIPFKDAVTAKISRKTKFRTSGKRSSFKLQYEYGSQIKVANRPPRSEINDSEKLVAMKSQGEALVLIASLTELILKSPETLEAFFADYDEAQRTQRLLKKPTHSCFSTAKQLTEQEVTDVLLSARKEMSGGDNVTLFIKTGTIQSSCLLSISKGKLGLASYSLNLDKFYTLSSVVDVIMRLEPTEISPKKQEQKEAA